jgi:hypothetical protein
MSELHRAAPGKLRPTGRTPGASCGDQRKHLVKIFNKFPEQKRAATLVKIFNKFSAYKKKRYLPVSLLYFQASSPSSTSAFAL